MPPAHLAAVEAERTGWYAVSGLVRSLTPRECVVPGYYTDPDWTVRDLVAHLGTWLAEAALQFERIHVGTYERREIDIDAINEALLAGMAGQPWSVAWVQANAARTRMLDEWSHLDAPTEDAAWWIRKAGGEHYAEHLGRLQVWTAELIRRRP
jgi:hypothetical protein